MLKSPPFNPFCFGAFFCPFSMVSEDPAPQSLTNAQKLALPANTAVGTQVAVSDGFVVSGAVTSTDVNRFWFNSGTMLGGHTVYQNTLTAPSQLGGGVGTGRVSFYDTDHWEIENEDGQNNYLSDQNVAEPWLVTSWKIAGNPEAITLTHPAIQQLAAPSTAQGGVFVSGATADGQDVSDGIYPINDTVVGPVNGRDAYMLLGINPSNAFDYCILWSGSSWQIRNTSQGTLPTGVTNSDATYYSLSDVATPDLATNWKNASDDTPASITVTSIPQGDLDAGATVAGAGTSVANATYTPRGVGPNGGEPFYNKLGDADTGTVSSIFDSVGGGGGWVITDAGGNAYYDAATVRAFPFGAFTTDSGTNPAPTVTRNDVAAEANWDVA